MVMLFLRVSSIVHLRYGSKGCTSAGGVCLVVQSIRNAVVVVVVVAHMHGRGAIQVGAGADTGSKITNGHKSPKSLRFTGSRISLQH